MIMKKYIYIAVLAGLTNSTIAQQTQLSSLYPLNRVMINPAEVGIDEHTHFSLGYREQWANYIGSPSTAWITGQTQLNEKMGIGGVVIYDKMSFVQNIDARLQYAYQLKIDRYSSIRFGLSAGMIQTGVNFSDVIADDYTDGILANPTFASTVFDAKVGVYYRKNDFGAGISVPQLLSPSKPIPNQQLIGSYDYQTHFNVYLDYRFKVNETTNFVPMFLLRRTSASYQFDIFANLRLENKYFIGLGVRQQGGIIVNLGLQAIKNVQVHYAYELSRNGAANRTGGTHELFLKITLPKKDKSHLEEDGTPRKATEKF
jgi:type IX secretion system PorP/SprF family membrane protein